jgi:phage baseplate assembly protein W
VSTVDDRRFGIDLSLEPSGGEVRDVRVVPPGDLATVRGPDAAVQALTLRLLVRRGELAALGWPDYGSRLHELVGELDTPGTRLRLAQYAREAVAGDPRVAEITQVTVTTDRFDARVALDVLLVGEPEPARLAVAVPIEAL